MAVGVSCALLTPREGPATGPTRGCTGGGQRRADPQGRGRPSGAHPAQFRRRGARMGPWGGREKAAPGFREQRTRDRHRLPSHRGARASSDPAEIRTEGKAPPPACPLPPRHGWQRVWASRVGLEGELGRLHADVVVAGLRDGQDASCRAEVSASWANERGGPPGAPPDAGDERSSHSSGGRTAHFLAREEVRKPPESGVARTTPRRPGAGPRRGAPRRGTPAQVRHPWGTGSRP